MNIMGDPYEHVQRQLKEINEGLIQLELQNIQVKTTLAHAIFWLLRAYESGQRQGWEPGPSVQETMNGIFTWLCNEGFDPTMKETPGFVPDILAALEGR